MHALLLKLGLFLCVWYEVSTELGVSGGTAIVVTLLVCGAAMMLLRLPGQILSLFGPRAVVLAGPVAVWFGLAWWLLPGAVGSYPALAMAMAAVLALIGAAAHYAVSRYPEWFARRWPALRGAAVPAACLALGLADRFTAGLLTLAVIAALLGMPLRLGWRFIGPVSPHKFDARMGDGDTFRRAGFSDDA